MVKQTQDRTRFAVGLCVCMLVVCLFAMGLYLRPSRVGLESQPQSGGFGMLLIDITDEEAADSYHVNSLGVYVLAVKEHGQAERAGISSGDRLTHVDTKPVESMAHFQEMQADFVPSQNVKLSFEKTAGTQTYSVTLAWEAE